MPIQTSRLTREELQLMAKSHGQPSVSLFMPTHRKGREIQQDPIRLKNLLSTAQEQLGARNLAGPAGEAILSFAQDLPTSAEETFWQHNADGLALFMQKEFSRCFRLPLNFDDLVVVADRFHIKPLLPYFQGDGHFYVLAASPNRVRLFEGGKHGLAEVESSLLPDNLVSALRIDEYTSSLQFHSHTVGGASGQTDDQAIYHGHGGGSDADKKEDLLKYFRKLDDAINEYFQDESAPLVFAGVEYLFPIYQQANNYRGLVDEPVTGNQDDADAETLHKASWKIVEPLFSKQLKHLIESYGRYAAHEQGSNDLSEILQAAREGRVSSLLLANGVRQWGQVQADGRVSIDQHNTGKNEDLLDLVATQTILHGGDVFLLDAQQLPSNSPLAAIYRY